MTTIRPLPAAVLAAFLSTALLACEDDKGGTAATDAARDAAPADAAASEGGATDAGGEAGAAVPVTANTSCSIVKKGDALTVAAGRQVVCALDIGSNNAKLVVMSLETGKPDTLRDERQCRNQLRLGNKTAPDATNPVGRPLPEADLVNLVLVMKEFQAICQADKGMLVGAEATQWARDATNRELVRSHIKAGTGLDLEVLTPDQEGQYGYVAATYKRPKKLSLDPGSNSFQVGFWLDGEPAARTFSVAFGYQRGAAKYYPTTTADSYDAARGKHADEMKTMIDAALAMLSPPSNLAALKAAIAGGQLGPELYIVGQDGALHLSVRGLLRDASGKWTSDKTAYDDRVAQEKPAPSTLTPGLVTTTLAPAEVGKFFTDIVKAPDFTTLRTDPVRGLYGEKALANAVLVDLLVRELGLTSVVLVPQEMPMGYILAKLN